MCAEWLHLYRLPTLIDPDLQCLLLGALDTSMSSGFQIGQHCQVRDQLGVVRFYGKTQFADGDWVGVELDSSQGRNDGSVNDIRYFTCSKEGQYGIFVRPQLVQADNLANNKPAGNVELIIERLQQKLRKTLEDIEEKKHNIIQLEESLNSKDLKIEHLESVIENSAVDTEYIHEHNSSLERALEETRSKYDELKREYDLVCEELNINKQLEEEVLALAPSQLDSNEVASLLKQNKKLNDAFEHLSTSHAETKRMLAEKEDALSVVSDELQHLKATHRATIETLEKSEETIRDLHLRLESILSLDDLIEHLSSQNETLQEKVNELTVTIEELKEIRELDLDLIQESKEVETNLRNEITGLAGSLKSYEKMVAELTENNTKLKIQLNKHVALTAGDKEGIIEVSRLHTGDEAGYLGSLLEFARSSRASIIDTVVPTSLKPQIKVLTDIHDLRAEILAVIKVLEDGPFQASKIILELSKSLGTVVFLESILMHNLLSEDTLLQLKSGAENGKKEVAFIRSKFLESDIACIDESCVLSCISSSLIPEEPLNMKYRSCFTHFLMQADAEMGNAIRLIRFLEQEALGKLPKELADIYQLMKSCRTSLARLRSNLEENSKKELMKYKPFDPERTLFIGDKLWSISKKVLEVHEAAMDDKQEHLQALLADLFSSSHDDFIKARSAVKSLQVNLEDTDLSFEAEASEDILRASVNLNEPSMRPALDDQPSPSDTSSDRRIRELELNISMLEQNLSSTSLKYAEDKVMTKKLVAKLKEDYENLEQRYRALVEENRSLEKQAHEYLALETLSLAGQQTKVFEDLASEKKYTEEAALLEEISFLRTMIKTGTNLTSATHDDDLSWLQKAVSMPSQKAKLPTYLYKARNRRAYAMRMLNTKMNSMASKNLFHCLRHH